MTVSIRTVYRTEDGRVEILELHNGMFEVVVDQWTGRLMRRSTLDAARELADQRHAALKPWDATDRDPLYVTIDGEHVFEAVGLAGRTAPIVRNYADAYHWNGFVVPLFSEAVARAVCAEFSDPENGTYTFQDDGTIVADESMLYPDDDPADLVQVWHPNADGLYAVGDSWTWCIADQDDAR